MTNNLIKPLPTAEESANGRPAVNLHFIEKESCARFPTEILRNKVLVVRKVDLTLLTSEDELAFALLIGSCSRVRASLEVCRAPATLCIRPRRLHLLDVLDKDSAHCL